MTWDEPLGSGRVAKGCSALLWSASIDELGPEDERVCLSLLSEDERERAQAFRVDCARRLYILAHAVCRTMLGSLLERPPGTLRFTTEPRGKPRLDLPEGPAFNLSHGGRLAVCAASRDAPVGVDVEPKERTALTLNLVRDLFASQEIAMLEGLDGDSLTEGLITVWTGKEAVVKAHGDGLYLPLDRFTVPLGDGPVVLDEGLIETASVWRLHRFQPDPYHRAALVLGLSPTVPLTIHHRHLTGADIVAGGPCR